MTEKSELSGSLSSSQEKPESGFAERLESLRGSESESSFAQRCEIPLSSMRKYLQGSMPGVDRAVQIAEKLGVSVSWLASGEGEMRPSSSERGAMGKPRTQSLDSEALQLAITVVEEALQRNNLKMRPADKAALISSNYDLLRITADKESIGAELRKILDGTLSRSWEE